MTIKMARTQEINIPEALRLRKLGYTLSQIAIQLGYTREGIRKALKKAEKGDVGVGI